MTDINSESGVQADELDLVVLIRFALSRLRIHPQMDLSILLVDETTTAEYHRHSMGLPDPTDVMSLPVDELREPAEDEEPPLGLLGGIVFYPQVTVWQVAENSRGPTARAEHLLIHDLLYLLGHDHAEPEEEVVMFGLNNRIIATWGVVHSNCRGDRPVNN